MSKKIIQLDQAIADPSDKEAIKTELDKVDPKPPCNIWGLIKEFKDDIESLKARVSALEKR